MPRRTVLTERQRAALFDLPQDEATLTRFYTLSEEEIAVVRRRRRPRNRIGFALQLCAFRYPGRLLQPGELIPERMLSFVAAQLGLSGDAVVEYAKCTTTRYQPAFPICIPSNDRALGEGADQASFAPCRVSDARGRARKELQRLSSAVRSVILAYSGRTSPVAGAAYRRSDGGSSHADTVTAGGPRRPLISVRMPANTCLGRAASGERGAPTARRS